MEPQLVLPVEESIDASAWPRILRILAVMMLVFGLVNVGVAAYSAYWIFFPPAAASGFSGRWHTILVVRTTLSIADGMLGLVMLFAAARILFKKRSHLLMMMTARLWLVLWLVEIAANALLSRPIRLGYLANNLLHEMVIASCPLLVWLVLREYSSDASR